LKKKISEKSGTFNRTAVLNPVNHSKPGMQTLVAIVLSPLAGKYLISSTLFALLGETNSNLYAHHNRLLL
jgi:hypothetical protein